MMVLTVECIIRCLNSDLYSYSEDLESINSTEGYFIKFNKENQKYWSDWFLGLN